MSRRDFRFGISSSVAGLDMNKLLVARPLSTYFMRVASDIPQLEVRAGDILVVDRALHPKVNDLIVVAEVDDPELKVIRYGEQQFNGELWGVAVHAIRSLRP